MYLPTYESLLRVLGTTPAAVKERKKVEISEDLFRFLLSLALEGCEFNEAGYVQANPDVAVAVEKGMVGSPREHYFGYGYFEGRPGASPKVDERWYLSTYPDVAQAVRQGQVHSAAEHFHVIGGGEGRIPNAAQAAVAGQWKKIVGK